MGAEVKVIDFLLKEQKNISYPEWEFR